MNFLKFLFLLFSALSIAVAVFGIGSVTQTQESEWAIADISVHDRIILIAQALFLAALAYGIHIRAPIVWKIGFILIGFTYIDLVTKVVGDLNRSAPVVDFLNFWLPIGATVIGGAVVCVYWGIWWNRHRSYFQEGP